MCPYLSLRLRLIYGVDVYVCVLFFFYAIFFVTSYRLSQSIAEAPRQRRAMLQLVTLHVADGGVT